VSRCGVGVDTESRRESEEKAAEKAVCKEGMRLNLGGARMRLWAKSGMQNESRACWCNKRIGGGGV